MDLTQDTDEVQSKAQVLLEAMAGGDAETAVDSILTEDWYTVMLSDLLIGQRNYTGAADNGIAQRLSIRWQMADNSMCK